MARHEQDREDLMRDAVALQERVELRIQGRESLVTIGFRSNAAMSVFFGQDPVYQFDAEGRLRRAFVDGMLFRSQHSTLAMLQRERSETQTILQRTDMDSDQLLAFRKTMLLDLELLQETLQQGNYQIVRAVPEDDDHISRIQLALETIPRSDPWLSSAIRRRN